MLAVYIPPGLISDDYKDVADYIVDAYDEITGSNEDCYLVIAGDMNQFPTQTIEAQLDVTQIVDSPTRGSAVLDKIFVDARLLRQLLNTTTPTCGASERDSLIRICPAVGGSDHMSVLMNPLAFSNNVPQLRKVYDYRASNMNKFKDKLAEFPWTSFYKANMSVDEKCDLLHTVIDDAMTTIPFTYVVMSNKDKPWMTPMLKSLINRRYEAFRRKNFPLYLHYKQKVKEEIAQAKERWTNLKMKSVTGLWSVVKSTANKENQQFLNGLVQDFDSIQEAVEQIGNKLSQSFSASPDWDDIFSNLPTDDRTWTPLCNQTNVYNSLRHLNIRKAAGSDGLPPCLLKDAAYELAPPLTHVIALSFDTCTVPSKWKKANIIPIPKKANPTLDDLRPLSMLPIFTKILEKIAIVSIKETMISMYGENQYGFRPHFSTAHAHIKLHDYLTRILDSYEFKAAVVISFDMKKAFDSLHHAHLMDSLKSSSLPSKALRWIASFLQDRCQSVRIKGISSTLKPVPSGVPQGSVIAPFLFAAHMGSLMPHDSSTLIVKYADDIVTVTPVKDPSQVDLIIKNEISSLHSWCQSHGLQLNTQKTKVMIPAKPGLRIPPLHGIETSSTLKILGIIFSENLKWDDHTRYVCRKASQRIFILKRLKALLPQRDLIQVYKALILSILEYNSPVMVGMSVKNTNCLEKVRKRCHRIICGVDCQCDAFISVRERRDHHALRLFASITNATHNLLHSIVPKRLPRSKKFAFEFCRTSRRLKSFVPFCTELANRLGL